MGDWGRTMDGDEGQSSETLRPAVPLPRPLPTPSASVRPSCFRSWSTSCGSRSRAWTAPGTAPSPDPRPPLRPRCAPPTHAGGQPGAPVADHRTVPTPGSVSGPPPFLQLPDKSFPPTAAGVQDGCGVAPDRKELTGGRTLSSAGHHAHSARPTPATKPLRAMENTARAVRGQGPTPGYLPP